MTSLFCSLSCPHGTYLGCSLKCYFLQWLWRERSWNSWFLALPWPLGLEPEIFEPSSFLWSSAPFQGLGLPSLSVSFCLLPLPATITDLFVLPPQVHLPAYTLLPLSSRRQGHFLSAEFSALERTPVNVGGRNEAQKFVIAQHISAPETEECLRGITEGLQPRSR